MPHHSLSGQGRGLGGRRQDCLQRGSGEQKVWRRMGALLVSKGKETVLPLRGAWQDKSRHPQLLLSACWQESISGEQGTQLPPIQQPAVAEEVS